MPALAPDAVQALLRECVTVVKPGETLVLRCPEGWTPEQAEMMQEHAARWLAGNAPDIRVLVVPHLNMAVMQPQDDAAFLARLERVWPEMIRREMRKQASNRIVPF